MNFDFILQASFLQFDDILNMHFQIYQNVRKEWEKDLESLS